MAKDWDDKGYWGKQNSIREIGDALGVDYSRYGVEGETTSRPGMPGSRGYEPEDYETAVINAMANDWDVRESLLAGKTAGNDRFEDLSDGINTAEEAYNIWNALEKTHSNDLGNGGNFSSANDLSNVSGYLWNDAFENLEFQGPIEEPEVEVEEEVEEDPYVVSTTIQNARDNTEAIHEARRNGTNRSDAIFNPQQAAGDLAGKFVINLSAGLQPSVQSNVRNSIDLVLGNKNPELDRQFGSGIYIN